MCSICDTGRPGELIVSLDCGGGVGSAFGGIAGDPSIKAVLIWPGENGGVGASGRLDETSGRGVDPLDPVPGPPCTGVLCWESADLGVSTWCDLALLGVDLVIVGLRVSMFCGRTISEGVIDSAHGLLEGSSVAALFLVLLSVLLSRRLFSPLTA